MLKRRAYRDKRGTFTFQFGDFTILFTTAPTIAVAPFTFQFGDFTIGLILYIEITML